MELLDESIQKVRSISHNMHSGILKELGLNEALLSFTHKLQSASFDIQTDLDENYETSNPESDISIYRILQELCGNIMKHGKSTFLLIRSEVENGILHFILTYNGSGLSQEEFERLRYESKGLGLKNIQNRIILLKGTIYFQKNEKNNNVQLYIPVNKLA